MKKMFLVMLALTALAVPAHAEWKWQHFGADPFAKTREEAMKNRPTAFVKMGLSQDLVTALIVATDTSGSEARIVKGDKFAIQVSGKTVHRDVIVAWASKLPDGMEYSAIAEKWQVVSDGKIYTVFLPKVCFNWSLTITSSAPPVTTTTVKPTAKTDVSSVACPGGYLLVANVWSLAAMPNDIHEKAKELIGEAWERDTENATKQEAYKPDAVSRTIGGRLRKEVKTRAPVNMMLKVVYRDPQTSAVRERFDNSFNVTSGIGRFQLPIDPKEFIIETIWPIDFLSPTISGGERRLWLFPNEWGKWCTMNIHGIVP